MYSVDDLHRDIEQFFKPQSVRLPCRFCGSEGRLTWTTTHCGHEVETSKECPQCKGAGSVEAAI